MRILLLAVCFFIPVVFLPAQEQGSSARNAPAIVPGEVIAHSAAASGLYIGSPSICILPNGDYLASHDLFGPNSNEFNQPVSRIYRSRNKGKTWKQVSEIKGQFWSKLFVQQTKLYFLGTSKHHGNAIIRSSNDAGVTWSDPVNGENGLLLEGEYHCAPMPVLKYKGRLWRTMEDAMGTSSKWGKRYGAMMLSIAEDADLMKAKNWQTTNVLRFDSTFLGGQFGGWIEGNAVVAPNGEVWNILRTDNKSSLHEKAAVVRVSADGNTATFDSVTGFIPFPGGSKKFSIKYDSVSALYWTLSNYIPYEVKQNNPGKNPATLRNTLALFSSDNLLNWDLRRIVLQHPDILKHGFQYVDWQIEKKNIIFVSRTAYDDETGGAHNQHDANFLTFHRIKKFRKIPITTEK